MIVMPESGSPTEGLLVCDPADGGAAAGGQGQRVLFRGPADDCSKVRKDSHFLPYVKTLTSSKGRRREGAVNSQNGLGHA